MAVPIGKLLREKQLNLKGDGSSSGGIGSKLSSSRAHISSLDAAIEALNRELDGSDSESGSDNSDSDSDNDIGNTRMTNTGKVREKGYVEKRCAGKTLSNADSEAILIYDSHREHDRIKPLPAGALPAPSCKTKQRGNVSKAVEVKHVQWYALCDNVKFVTPHTIYL